MRWKGTGWAAGGFRKPQPAPTSSVDSSDPLGRLPHPHRSGSPSSRPGSGHCANTAAAGHLPAAKPLRSSRPDHHQDAADRTSLEHLYDSLGP